MSKLITELTSEQLIELLDKKAETEEIKSYLYTKSDVLDFITFHRLKTGQERIPSNVVYDLYKRWSKKPLGKRAFLLQFQTFMPTNSDNTFTYCLLNLDLNTVLKRTFEIIKGKKPRSRIHSKGWKRHFDSFLERHDITPGTFYMKDAVFHNLYDKWTYDNNKEFPLSYRQFVKFCKLYFKHKQIGKNFWYAVSKSVVPHLSDEMIRQLKDKKVVKHAKRKKDKTFKY